MITGQWFLCTIVVDSDLTRSLEVTLTVDGGGMWSTCIIFRVEYYIVDSTVLQRFMTFQPFLLSSHSVFVHFLDTWSSPSSKSIFIVYADESNIFKAFFFLKAWLFFSLCYPPGKKPKAGISKEQRNPSVSHPQTRFKNS